MTGDTRAASTVSDHPFSACPWWSRCKVCGLSEAAHVSTHVHRVTAQEYRCPDCVSARDFGRPLLHPAGECPR